MRRIPTLKLFSFQIHPLLFLGAAALLLGFLSIRLLALLDIWVLGTGAHLALANVATDSITAGALFLLAAASIILYVAGWIGLILGLTLSILSPLVTRFQQSLAE